MTTLGDRLSELQRPEAYDHAATAMRLIETHISWVLLVGPFAYKIRKPVDFGFLDFTTLDRRRADCVAEVELNRRLALDLYVGVVDIVERDGRLCMGGAGTPIEPAVKMRRLPESGMLPALIERGVADERLMIRLAGLVADFHTRAATGPGIDEYGSVATIRSNWLENFDQTESCVGRTIEPALRAEIRRYVEHVLDRERPLLEQRVIDGRIRDGHGDLHANSVCVKGRRLYLFDCIEFNARFRCSDVAAEVAFLAMDLDHYGRADLAQTFVDAYVRRSGDSDLPKLLPFYKCYRAYVRGKILSFRLAEPGLSQADIDQIVREARAYFDLAHAYARPLPSQVLVVMGLPASGKSTIARAAARRLGLVHLSSDMIRKQLAGLRPTCHQRESFGRGLYSQSMSRRTYATLRREAARWLRRGHSVVLDATYGQPAERAAVRHLARRSAAHLVTVLCTADESTLRARLVTRERDPSSVSDAREDLWPALRAAFKPPCEVRDIVTIDTTQPLDQAIEQILAHVRAGLAITTSAA